MQCNTEKTKDNNTKQSSLCSTGLCHPINIRLIWSLSHLRITAERAHARHGQYYDLWHTIINILVFAGRQVHDGNMHAIHLRSLADDYQM